MIERHVSKRISTSIGVGPVYLESNYKTIMNFPKPDIIICMFGTNEVKKKVFPGMS